MDLVKYQEQASRTCPDLVGKVLTAQDLNNLHMILGMQTEVGELTDVFKRQFAYGKAVDWVNVEEELGDILFYIVNFARINDIDLNSVMAKNINKLKVRYPDKFDSHFALNRELDQERKVLERDY